MKEEDELIRVLRDDSLPIDAVKWNSVGDRVISRANVTDETKRIVRQIKKQRPGFFWTLFRVTFEARLTSINFLFDLEIYKINFNLFLNFTDC